MYVEFTCSTNKALSTVVPITYKVYVVQNFLGLIFIIIIFFVSGNEPETKDKKLNLLENIFKSKKNLNHDIFIKSIQISILVHYCHSMRFH